MTSSCEVSDDGVEMTCVTPMLPSGFNSKLTVRQPLATYIGFEMDGVEELRNLWKNDLELAHFSYYPDPTFHNFSEVDNIRQIVVPNNSSQTRVELNGKDLSTMYQIHIIIGDRFYCNATKVNNDNTMLDCIINYNNCMGELYQSCHSKICFSSCRCWPL